MHMARVRQLGTVEREDALELAWLGSVVMVRVRVGAGVEVRLGVRVSLSSPPKTPCPPRTTSPRMYAPCRSTVPAPTTAGPRTRTPGSTSAPAPSQILPQLKSNTPPCTSALLQTYSVASGAPGEAASVPPINRSGWKRAPTSMTTLPEQPCVAHSPPAKAPARPYVSALMRRPFFVI